MSDWYFPEPTQKRRKPDKRRVARKLARQKREEKLIGQIWYDIPDFSIFQICRKRKVERTKVYRLLWAHEDLASRYASWKLRKYYDALRASIEADIAELKEMAAENRRQRTQ